MPPLAAFAAPPDIEAQLEAIDAETKPLGLRMSAEIRAELPRGGGAVIARAYEGVDLVGERTSATRVATSRGVVLAVGPSDAGAHATELLPALVPGETGRPEDGAFRSLTDLNDDGMLDVVLRGRSGALEVHRVFATGSARYETDMSLVPKEVADVDGDGRIDLVGRVPVAEDDPIRPSFIEVATFERGAYRASSAAAITFHASRADAPPQRSESPVGDASRLRRALERAWHALHAGRDRASTLEALTKEPVPASLRASFDKHVTRLRADAGAKSPSRGAEPRAAGTPAGT